MASTQKHSEPPLFQFSLRTLIFLVLGTAVYFGYSVALFRAFRQPEESAKLNRNLQVENENSLPNEE